MTDQHVQVAAVIVAAGRGRRAGGNRAKQWQTLCGKRVIDHTLAAFEKHPLIAQIVLVLNPAEMENAPAGVIAVPGGAERAASVRAGLRALADQPPDHVLIHDVARPCVTPDLIDRVCDALSAYPGAAPAVPVTDALWHGENGMVAGTRDRAGLFRAQTPQGFRYPEICAAHDAQPGDNAPDDVAVARAFGLDVAIVDGEEDNLKITVPADFKRAARILEDRHGD